MKRALLLILLLACASPAFAADPKYSSDQWLAFYYRNPKPERFVEEVRAMSSGGYFSKEPSQPPLIAFLGRVMAQNPGKIEGWMKALDDLPQRDKDVLYTALWFSGTEEGKQCLQARGIKDYLGKNPPEILKMEIDSPTVIDMLWAWYFATGDATAVRRIVSAFNLSEHEGAMERFKTSSKTALDKRSAYQDLAFRSAQWSLVDNCTMHPEVRAICEKLYGGNSLNKMENLWLGVILAKVAPGKYKIEPGSTQWTENGKPVTSKPNVNSKDGFSVMLFLTDDARMFDGRNKQGATGLEPLKKARRSVPVYMAVLLSDPGVDAAGAADITFDMVVRKPDGVIFAQKKDAVCWKGKYDVPAHYLQFSKGYMAIQINPGDLPGVYTVETVVRDHIKKLDVPVKTTFEVP
ncbi:MAG: hypothetical protein WCH43_06305 [Verrucomicrobiota bacterium]